MRKRLLTATLLISSVIGLAYSTSIRSSADGISPFTHILDESENAPADQTIASLRQFLSRGDIAERERHEASYVLGRLLQKVSSASNPDQYKDAVERFTDASKIDSLNEKSLWHISELASANNDEDRLRNTLWQIHESTKSPHTKAATEYGIAQSYVRTQQLDKAVEAFTFAQKSTETEYATGANYYLGDLALRDQQNQTAMQQGVKFFETYLAKSPGGHFSSEICNRMKNLMDTHKELEYSPKIHSLMGDAYYSTGQWKLALDAWQQGSSAPNPIHKVLALFHCGRAKESQAALFAAIRANPKLSFTLTADTISTPLTRDDTKSFWKEVLAAHPEREDAALWNIGKRSASPESAGYYKQLIARYPTSEFAPESLWWLFWDVADSCRNDPARVHAALTMAQEGLRKYPTTKTGERFGFWAGKLHERLGETALAKSAYLWTVGHFPHGYYGMRSRARLAAIETKQLDTGWRVKPGRQLTETSWNWPTPQAIMSYGKMEEVYGGSAAEMCKLRQYDECLALLPADVSPEFKSAIWIKMKDPMKAIGCITKNLEGTPKTNQKWQLAYPRLFSEFVIPDSKPLGLDPLLVHALIREESRYLPTALSRSKALGLMQLMPGTAAGVAKRIGVHLSGNDDCFIPEINIKLGTDYLAYVIKRFNGQAMLAVASYNGGPNAVQSWYSQFTASGSTDLDQFVENIKFRETRDYVRKVFGSYYNYEAIYSLSETERKQFDAIESQAQALKASTKGAAPTVGSGAGASSSSSTSSPQAPAAEPSPDTAP